MPLATDADPPRVPMQSTSTDSRQPFVPNACLLPTPDPSSAPPSTAVGEFIEALPTSRGFAALPAAYRASSGTARGDDIARLPEDHGLRSFIGLARLMATGEVFGSEWGAATWVPMFQLDLRDLSVRPSARMVLAELGDGFDGWARAGWFARADRFVAAG